MLRILLESGLKEFEGRLRLLKEKKSEFYHPVLVFDVAPGPEGPKCIPLKEGDRLLVFCPKDLELENAIFDELLIKDRRPPHDLKFKFSFIPLLKAQKLAFWLECFERELWASVARYEIRDRPRSFEW